MKKTRILIFSLFLLGMLLLSACSPRDISKADILVGQDFTLKSGEVHQGTLNITGGVVKLEQNSIVKGNVIVTGSKLTVEGQVTGDIIATGGAVDLGNSARVDGGVFAIGSTFHKSDKAVVKGNIPSMQGRFDSQRQLPAIPSPSMTPWFNLSPLTDMLGTAANMIGLALLAVLVTVIMPRPVERVGKAAFTQPLMAAGFAGLALLLGLVLTITLILIPLALIEALVLFVAYPFGMIGLGLMIGRKLASACRQDWADPLAAGAGVFILVVSSGLAAATIPCIGWLLPFFIGLIGIGGVIVTRFGSREYVLGPSVPSRPVDPWRPADEAPVSPVSPEREEPVHLPPADQVAAVDEPAAPQMDEENRDASNSPQSL